MPDIELKVDGDDTFVIGMDSYTMPSRLTSGEYQMAMNIVNRGGIAYTRPGSASLFNMPAGHLQGCTLFRPSVGGTALVFVVDGVVYASYQPFRTYFRLNGIAFNKNAKFIAWSSCVKSTDYTNEGVLYYLDKPISVLVMQDGVSRAAYWDGSTARHLNPSPSNQEFTKPGYDETPVGLWMYWSNNRLWVSRQDQVFASDIGNPLKFTETQYLNEARAFYLPGPCTGIAEIPDRSGIMCFTDSTGTLIQSAIQDRTQWLNTPSFSKIVLPNIGCVAPRSIVHQYGLLWWWTPKGLVSQNEALALNITSRIDVQDNEMIQSKANLSYDLSTVCGSYIENYLLHAVPNGDRVNNRIHVLDQAPFEAQMNSWPSYWTGWRPVEFASGIVGSRERVFCCSQDYDGVNRMWELFRSDRTDNGLPITSFILTRQHLFGDRDWKKFRYAEVELRGISGPTAIMVGVGGMKGAFQKVMSKDVNAVNGQVYYNYLYGDEANQIAGTSSQIRVVRTTDNVSPSDCNSECIETQYRGLIDKAFSLLIVWSGIAGVSAYRIFTQFESAPNQGTCEDDEEDPRVLNEDNCGQIGVFSTGVQFDSYYATATFSKINPNTGAVVTKTCTQESIINQQDATRKAEAMAEWYVLSEIGEIV